MHICYKTILLTTCKHINYADSLTTPHLFFMAKDTPESLGGPTTDVIDLAQPETIERSIQSLRSEIESRMGNIDGMMSDLDRRQLEDAIGMAGLSPRQIEKDTNGDIYIITKSGRMTLSEFIQSL